MKTTAVTIPGISPASIGLGLLAVVIVFIALSGRKVPVISNERTALVILLVIGMAMCTNGIGRVAAAGAWTHPLAILGYLLGALILVVGILAAFGVQLPYIPGPREAIITISLLTIAKLALSALHRMFFM